jgi:hypothetical protein
VPEVNHKYWLRRTLPHFAIILLVVASVFAFAWLIIDTSLCNNDVYEEIASPSGTYKAVIFERNCGATTDFSYQVSILKADKSLSQSDGGNVFIADSNHGAVEVNVRVRWIDNTVLEVRYPARSRVFEKNDRIGDVTIRYSTD